MNQVATLMRMLATNADPKSVMTAPTPKNEVAHHAAKYSMAVFNTSANRPSVSMVTGRLRALSRGFIVTLIRARNIERMKMFAMRELSELNVMHGISVMAKLTAMAVIIQRTRNLVGGSDF